MTDSQAQTQDDSRRRRSVLCILGLSLVFLAAVLAMPWLLSGTRETITRSSPEQDAAASDPIQAWQYVEDFPRPLAQFRTVFWEPRDTESLRELIRSTSLVRDRSVLEIGTGTGLVALCCLQAGASRVVATDVNPWAISNARYNAEQFDLADRLETRRVTLQDAGAFAVIGKDERFDLVISNPPWEDDSPQKIADFALYDDGFRLLQSMLEGLPRHVTPGGRTLLAYGCVAAIRELQERARRLNLETKLLDDRSLDELPPVFLPGMLIEVKDGSRYNGPPSP